MRRRGLADRGRALALLAAACGVAACGVAACSGAPPVAQVQVRIEPAKPGGSAEPSGGALLATIVAVVKPSALKIDGDTTEWGSLAPLEDPSPDPPPDKAGSFDSVSYDPAPDKAARDKAARDKAARDKAARDEAAPKKPSFPPRNHLAIAIDSDGVTLAGELTAAAANGLWIGIRTDVPEVPPAGPQIPWNDLKAADCEDLPDGSKDLCKKVLAAHEAFAARYVAGFERFYRLDRRGLRVATDGGAPAAIPGSKVAFQDGERGITFEATFPPKALPRTLQAPLVTLFAAARGTESEKAPDLHEQWQSMRLPFGVGFEPYAGLRCAAFDQAHAMGGPEFMISYQPGDPLDLQALGYGPKGHDLEIRPQLLFSPEAKLGDVEVGYVYTGFTALGALRGGELLGMETLSGTVMGTVKRGDELHFFTFESHEGGDDTAPQMSATWHVASVRPDGQVRTDLLPDDDFAWSSAIEVHEEDLSSFGVMGFELPDGSGRPMVERQITWTYDAKKKAYVSKVRRGPDKARPAKPVPKKK